MRILIAALAATVMFGKVLAADLIANGNFNDGLKGWWTTENLTPLQVDGQLCARIPGGTINRWDAIIGQDVAALEKGESYEFTFRASGDPRGPINALVQENKAPWTAYASAVVQALQTPETQIFSFVSPVETANAQIVFQVGSSADPWIVCFDEVSLLGGADVQVYRPDTGSPVRVNQVGYLPDGPKRATLVSDEENPLEWTLENADGQVLARGQTLAQGLDPSSGLMTQTIDFSEFAEPGVAYRVSVAGETSHPFSISNGLYADLVTNALGYFYLVRSGIEISGALAGAAYERPAGHIGVAPNTGDTDVPCQAAESSLEAYGVPWTCDYSLDVSGGWYDAGDHGKYVVNGGISTAQIMTTYERNPEAFADGQLAIPESGNGVPDILDEVRWELEWFLKMQVPEGKPLAGMVHHKIHDNAWIGLPLLPHLDDKPRELHRPSTAATLNLAAAAGQGARLFRAYDAEFADRLLAGARRAWTAATANPEMFAPLEDGNAGGGAYDDTELADEFFWAAAELFLTTNETQWLREVEFRLPETSEAFAKAAFDWQTVWALPFMNLLMVDSDLPLPLRDTMRYQLLAAANAYVDDQKSEAFGQMYSPKDASYAWGSNHLQLQNAIVVATAYDLTGDEKYRAAMLEAMDYIFGRNALNIAYVTGYGTHFSRNQHSRWFAHQLDPALPNPPKGALAGGPNSSIQDPVAQRLLSGCVAQFCYVDDIESWSTNEITINWNAALVQIAALLTDD